ncbi:MAG: hypothetical protein UV38_C0001G0130 [candidate division TM6 bacterium GW2011_GWE2_42_60]|nr:MAG: hypothetical protein UV38_C0001G0130 [candidate division TM6 bacterium GW2011_GWE2_42_60]HBY05673.1 hypothetical protein [Candidatus Dependentiae bacterium]
MKNTLRQVTTVLALLSVGAASAWSEVRTPRPGEYGFLTYPIKYHEKHVEKTDGCGCWDWEFVASGMGYYRSGDRAYKCGRCTEEWTTLLFGRGNASFALRNIFYGSALEAIDVGNNPFINFATLSPRFEYRESGAMVTAQLGSFFKMCDKDYRLGLRARLPFRDIEVSDTCAASDLVGETLKDVWQVRQETEDFSGNNVTNTVYAGRLDFLTSLNGVAIPPQEIVNYRNTAMANHVTMSNYSVDNGPSYVVNLISRTDGSMPSGATPVWGAVTSTTDLSGDGSGLANNDRARFNYATDYQPLGANMANQGKLFVVPTLDANGDILPANNTIRSEIELAIQNLDDSVSDFLAEQGLCFCNGRSKGLSDLDLEFYLGRNWGCDDRAWTDLMFAVRFPTAKALCKDDSGCNCTCGINNDSCKRLLKQPLGNNKHYEVRLGLAAGYDIRDWVKFMLDANYSWVLRHKENMAAPFKGATVKNIGPCVAANKSWGYFVGDAKLSFFASDCCWFDVGYQLYHKRCDCIKLCVAQATEFIDRGLKDLDASVARRYTDRTAHKGSLAFNSRCGACDLTLGWSHTFAGKNISRDTDWYLQASVTF